jgi:spore coat polysaccharide biosynthesis predicted glycosyltransferase SpsG
VPFRKSISKRTQIELHNSILKVLVVGGGTDAFNFVPAVYNKLKSLRIEFNVILFSDDMRTQNLDPRFCVIPIGINLDNYSEFADIVLTTASTISLEFIAREIPVAIACAVENQEEYFDTLVGQEVAYPIGRFLNGKWNFIDSNIEEVLNSPKLRQKLRTNSRKIFDLQGSKRIVEEIRKLGAHENERAT